MSSATTGMLSHQADEEAMANSPHAFVNVPMPMQWQGTRSVPACSTATQYIDKEGAAVNQADMAAHEPPQSTNRIMLGVAWSLTSLVFGIMASIVGPTATILANNMAVEESALGPVMGANGIATLVGGMPSGWLLDHVPGNKLLALALLIEAAGYVLMPLCTTIWQLTAVYGAVGFVFNVINTGINVMVIWQFKDPRELAFVLNLVSAMFGLGGMLAPQVVSLAMLVSTGELAYPITASLCLVMCAWTLCLSSPVNSKKQAHLRRLASGEPGGVPRVTSHQSIRSETLRPRRPWSVLVPSMLVVFFNVSIELGFAAWIFMYAKSVSHVDEFAAEGLTSTYWLAFTAMRTLAVGLAACMPASHILLLSMPLAILGALWPLLYPSVASTLVSVVCVGIGAAAGFPNTLSLTAEQAELDGTLNGVISTVAGLAMTVMPSAVPFLAHADPARGFTWLMIITLVFAIGQLLFLVVMLAAGNRLKKQHIRRTESAPAPGDMDDLYTPFLIPPDGAQ